MVHQKFLSSRLWLAPVLIGSLHSAGICAAALTGGVRLAMLPQS